MTPDPYSPHGLGTGVGRGLGVAWGLGAGVGLGVGVGLPEAVAVPVGVAVPGGAGSLRSRAARPLEISMESLILAQDERWRRA